MNIVPQDEWPFQGGEKVYLSILAGKTSKESLKPPLLATFVLAKNLNKARFKNRMQVKLFLHSSDSKCNWPYYCISQDLIYVYMGTDM